MGGPLSKKGSNNHQEVRMEFEAHTNRACRALLFYRQFRPRRRCLPFANSRGTFANSRGTGQLKNNY